MNIYNLAETVMYQNASMADAFREANIKINKQMDSDLSPTKVMLQNFKLQLNQNDANLKLFNTKLANIMSQMPSFINKEVENQMNILAKGYIESTTKFDLLDKLDQLEIPNEIFEKVVATGSNEDSNEEKFISETSLRYKEYKLKKIKNKLSGFVLFLELFRMMYPSSQSPQIINNSQINITNNCYILKNVDAPNFKYLPSYIELLEKYRKSQGKDSITFADLEKDASEFHQQMQQSK